MNSNIVDSAVDAAESEKVESEKDKRPRARYYVCISIAARWLCSAILVKKNEKSIIADAIQAETKEEAAKIFHEKHSLDATNVERMVFDTSDLVYEPVQAETKADAVKAFSKRHDPSFVFVDDGGEVNTENHSGYYVARGTGMGEIQRVTITVGPDQIARRTSATYKAQFKGWNVYASGLRSCAVGEGSSKKVYKDNELVSLTFDSLINPTAKAQRPKMKKNEVVRLVDLNDPQLT